MIYSHLLAPKFQISLPFFIPLLRPRPHLCVFSIFPIYALRIFFLHHFKLEIYLLHLHFWKFQSSKTLGNSIFLPDIVCAFHDFCHYSGQALKNYINRFGAAESSDKDLALRPAAAWYIRLVTSFCQDNCGSKVVEV